MRDPTLDTISKHTLSQAATTFEDLVRDRSLACVHHGGTSKGYFDRSKPDQWAMHLRSHLIIEYSSLIGKSLSTAGFGLLFEAVSGPLPRAPPDGGPSSCNIIKPSTS